MQGVLSMLPGVGKMKKQMASANLDETIFMRQEAIIGSMTRKERQHPKVLNASRKKRVAAGSGTSVQEINKLLKMHRQMADMMKKMGRQKGGLKGLFGGSMPDMGAMAQEAQMPADMSKMPSGLPGLGSGLPPGGMPGLGTGSLPGLPGLPKRKK